MYKLVVILLCLGVCQAFHLIDSDALDKQISQHERTVRAAPHGSVTIGKEGPLRYISGQGEGHLWNNQAGTIGVDGEGHFRKVLGNHAKPEVGGHLTVTKY